MVRHRRSKKIGPFRITLTQRGVSTSVGAAPFRISKGTDGANGGNTGDWRCSVPAVPAGTAIQRSPLTAATPGRARDDAQT